MQKIDLLTKYLDGSQSGYGWEKIQNLPFKSFWLHSQIWRGIPWRHKIWIIEPITKSPANLAVILLTGDEVLENDLNFAQRLANSCKSTVYVIFGIPNQPLWDMREDDLIAHTFEQFLSTGDPDWPLLFPMTRAAIAAIDFAQEQEISGGNADPRFILTGASKRGWTTWLAAAMDSERIAGIAPMVFDMLNINVQVKAMESDWGGPSPMHEDYSRRQLQKITTGPDNHQLIHSVDPFTYRSNLTMPKLIISGSNDPFWLSNSSDYFRHELPGQTNHLLIPNAGHEMGDGTMTFVALGAFADHLRANSILPRLDFNISNDKLIVTYTHKPKSLKVWQAESENLWFSDQCFTQICISTDAMEAETTFNLASNSKNQAIFVEAIFSNLSEDYSLSTPMKIYKKQT